MNNQPPASLPSRLAALEDRIAVYTLLASPPPSADTTHAEQRRKIEAQERRIATRQDAVRDALRKLDPSR